MRSDRPRTAECPCEDIFKVFNAVMGPSMVRVNVGKIPDGLKSKLAARWAEDQDRQSLIWWEDYFLSVEASDFLTGRPRQRQGGLTRERGRDWRASVSWILERENMEKILMGNYVNPPVRDDRFDRAMAAAMAWLERRDDVFCLA